MNVYKMQAKGLENFLEKHQELNTATKEDITAKIKIFNILSELTKQEVYGLFDTGIYNSVTAAYFERAMQKCKLDRDTIIEILDAFNFLLDEKTAAEIMQS